MPIPRVLTLITQGQAPTPQGLAPIPLGLAPILGLGTNPSRLCANPSRLCANSFWLGANSSRLGANSPRLSQLPWVIWRSTDQSRRGSLQQSSPPPPPPLVVVLYFNKRLKHLPMSKSMFLGCCKTMRICEKNTLKNITSVIKKRLLPFLINKTKTI